MANSILFKHLGGILKFGYSELFLDSVRVEEVASKNQRIIGCEDSVDPS